MVNYSYHTLIHTFIFIPCTLSLINITTIYLFILYIFHLFGSTDSDQAVVALFVVKTKVRTIKYPGWVWRKRCVTFSDFTLWSLICQARHILFVLKIIFISQVSVPLKLFVCKPIPLNQGYLFNLNHLGEFIVIEVIFLFHGDS